MSFHNYHIYLNVGKYFFLKDNVQKSETGLDLRMQFGRNLQALPTTEGPMPRVIKQQTTVVKRD